VIRALHVVAGFGAGGAERVAASLLRTFDREQFDVGAISLRGPFGTDTEQTLAQDGIPVWYMGKERGFDPLVLARVARTMEHFRPPEILNGTDVFVLSSDYEGNPLSVMEAMAAGKPMICTAVGGVPELVEDGECGLLVPQRSEKALADAMRYMLESPEARESMGKASARRAVERFDLRVMTEAYENLYRTAIAKSWPSRKVA
jgi:glycosyltransferase involved in cell wall biosynthesis